MCDKMSFRKRKERYYDSGVEFSTLRFLSHGVQSYQMTRVAKYAKLSHIGWPHSIKFISSTNHFGDVEVFNDCWPRDFVLTSFSREIQCTSTILEKGENIRLNSEDDDVASQISQKIYKLCHELNVRRTQPDSFRAIYRIVTDIMLTAKNNYTLSKKSPLSVSTGRIGLEENPAYPSNLLRLSHDMISPCIRDNLISPPYDDTILKKACRDLCELNSEKDSSIIHAEDLLSLFDGDELCFSDLDFDN